MAEKLCLPELKDLARDPDPPISRPVTLAIKQAAPALFKVVLAQMNAGFGHQLGKVRLIDPAPLLVYPSKLREDPCFSRTLRLSFSVFHILFDLSIEKLFNQENDFKEVIKRREIYQVLELATDKCEDAANVIESIIVKYA